MIEQGSVTYRHSGTHASAMKTFFDVITNKAGTILQIQKKLVDEAKPPFETSAGQSLKTELDRLRERYKELQELQAGTTKAASQRDEQLFREIAREARQQVKRLQELENERDILENKAKWILSEKG